MAGSEVWLSCTGQSHSRQWWGNNCFQQPYWPLAAQEPVLENLLMLSRVKSELDARTTTCDAVQRILRATLTCLYGLACTACYNQLAGPTAQW